MMVNIMYQLDRTRGTQISISDVSAVVSQMRLAFELVNSVEQIDLLSIGNYHLIR